MILYRWVSILQCGCRIGPVPGTGSIGDVDILHPFPVLADTVFRAWRAAHRKALFDRSTNHIYAIFPLTSLVLSLCCVAKVKDVSIVGEDLRALSRD